MVLGTSSNSCSLSNPEKFSISILVILVQIRHASQAYFFTIIGHKMLNTYAYVLELEAIA